MTATPIPPTDTPLPPTAAPTDGDGSCDNAPRPQLQPGDNALQLGADALRLRSQPNTSSQTLQRVYRMQRVKILSAPVCRDGYHFYEALTEAGERGWLIHAESYWNARKSWLVRVDDERDCFMQPRFVPGHLTRHDFDRRTSVRQAPSVNAPEAGRAISKGMVVEILAGPVCADAFVWYQIQNQAQGLLGWAQQGGGDRYFFAEPHGYRR